MAVNIVIIGGGVGGLSAAHELIQRKQYTDFSIRVYEADPRIPGGKARSLPVPDSATPGHDPLPSEHGFRFFPGFYQHLPATMQTIPIGAGTAYDNLVPTSRLLIGRFTSPPFVTISGFPTSLEDIVQIIKDYFSFDETGLTHDDVTFFGAKLWQIMTSCQDRRLAEYEKITWWDFVEAEGRSEAYQNFLAKGLARSLTANDPHKGNTRTLGDIYVQLLLNIIEPHQVADRLLNGPTNEVWVDPWRAYLESQGVTYSLGMTAQSITCVDGRIASVTFSDEQGVTSEVSGDYFIFAVPVEVMALLLERDNHDGQPGPIIRADPRLAGIIELRDDVAWMNGLQYYLTEDVPIVHGHQLYVDTPWAITAVSQIQFWAPAGYDIAKHGDGKVKGVLSTDISNWDEPGILYGKPAKDCADEEIAKEVWEQIKRSLGPEPVLRDDMLHRWYLDPDIQDQVQQGINQGVIHTDSQPLLVNRINRWRFRPEATSSIPNLLLASDYVRTNTDLACMEAANEAARRAVNGLLAALGSAAPPCQIWELEEPAILAPWRWHDQRRFDQGLPWDSHLLPKPGSPAAAKERSIALIVAGLLAGVAVLVWLIKRLKAKG